MDKTILVIGATGMLGKPVALALQSSGYNVRVFSRDVNKAREFFGNSFELAYGDVSDRTSLEEALKGCYGVHVNLSGGPTPDSYDLVEHKGALNTAIAALKTGVERLSLITGASVDEGNTWFYTTNAKYNAEESVKGSGINYTIFRPSWFMESLALFIRGKKAMLIGKQTTPLSWVAAADYARIVAASFGKEEAKNKVFYVLGPEKISMEEALNRFVNRVISDVKVKTISPGVARFIAKITRNEALKDITGFMEYCEKIGKDMEMGTAEETNKLFGAPETTLDKWIEDYLSRAPGKVFS